MKILSKNVFYISGTKVVFFIPFFFEQDVKDNSIESEGKNRVVEKSAELTDELIHSIGLKQYPMHLI